MAVLAVAAAGASAGYAAFGAATFLGVSATAWGWTIGSIVGNALFAPRTNAEGPRLTSVRFSQSSYGAALPIVIGAMRAGGNVIWAGEVVEIADRQKVGKRAYQTSYTYRQSFAVSFCAGEIDGIRRIWFDQELVYSVVSGDVLSEIVSGEFAEQMTTYLGSDTQLADATIEAEEGAGSVPAYRGVVYVVFEDIDLTPWGNRIPSVTAEIIESASTAVPRKLSTLGIGQYGRTGMAVDGAVVLIGIWNSTFVPQPVLWRLQSVDPSTGDVLADEYKNGVTYIGSDGLRSSLPETVSYANGYSRPVLNDPYVQVGAFGADPTISQWTNGNYWMVAGPLGITLTPAPDIKDCAIRLGDYVYAIVADGSTVQVVRSAAGTVDVFNTAGGDVIGQAAYIGPADTTYAIGADIGGGAAWMATDGQYIYAHWTGSSPTLIGKIHRFSPALVLLEIIAVTAATPGFVVADDKLIVCSQYLLGNYTLTQARMNFDGVPGVSYGTVTVLGTNTGSATYPQEPQPVHVGGGVFTTVDAEWSIADLQPGTRTLAQAIGVVTGAAGIVSGDLDTTLVAGINVDGYLIDRRMPARSALEPLLAAYAVDGVETAGKLKFVPRGGSVVATINYDDLGAYADGEQAAEALIQNRVREQQAALPQRVDVAYSALAKDYEPGAQTAQRGQVLSEQQVSVELPLALSEAQAAQTAHRLLYELWAGRTRREFATDLRHAALEPSDTVLLEEERGTLSRLRLTAKSEDNGRILWEAVEDDDGTQTQIAPGAALPPAAVLRPPNGSTAAVLFESPPLDDAQVSSIGIYAAAAPRAGTWPGAGLWTSSVGGTDFTLAGAITVQTAVGSAQTALASWAVTSGQARPDTVDVTAFGATLETLSIADWLAGGNLAFLGNELIRFRTATDLGSGRWRLAGLLRGQHGTDYAASEHAIGEGFALLDPAASAHFITLPSATIDVAREFRPVTNGQNVAETTAIPHVLVARTLKPLPPVNVSIVRQSNGDRTIRWQRRARAYQSWREAADVPLVESSESYRLEIYSTTTGALLRTATASAASYTYAAASWQADFAVPPTTIRVLIYQQSGLLGDGEAADVTLAWADDFNATYPRDFNENASAGLSIASMTTYGVSPQLVSSLPTGNGWPAGTRAVGLTQNSGAGVTDAKGRFDLVSSFVNGRLRVTLPKIYNLLGTTTRAGLAARTSHWRNNTGGFGYVVEFLHNTGAASIRLVRGTNSDTGTITQIGSIVSLVTTSTDISEMVWELNGASHKVWVDGVLRINETDSTHSAAGACGLYVYGGFGETATFDNFRVDYLSI